MSSLLQGFQTCRAFVVVVALLCVAFLYHDAHGPVTSTDYPKAIEQLGGSKIEFVSVYEMFVLRLILGLTLWFSSLWAVLEPNGLRLTLEVRGKKKQCILRNHRRFTTYTMWCWAILGVYMLVAVLCSYAAFPDSALQLPHQLLEITPILFEVSFAMSYLVTIIVSFILIPGREKSGLPTDVFFHPLAILAHNYNVFVMMIEVCLNRVTIQLRHLPYVVLFGVAYICFSWVWFELTGVFYYFFLDYEHPNSVLWLMGLLTTCSLFYLLGVVISAAEEYTPSEYLPLVQCAIVVFSISIMTVVDRTKPAMTTPTPTTKLI